jgi:uncharacterized membrane protein
MKKYLIYLMAAAYTFAGINHFWHPGFYLKMLVGFLPYPEALNYISGVAEILIGIGLVIPATRRFSAWALIALLLAVFPANINMAIHHEQFGLPAAGLYLRLPVQLLLIWWAYIYTKPRVASA